MKKFEIYPESDEEMVKEWTDEEVELIEVEE